MPELPEVESLRLSLLPHVVRQKIKKVEVRKPKLVSGRGNVRVISAKKKKEFEKELVGEIVRDIVRRAKNLIFLFESGKVVIVHLKMTGQLVYEDKAKHRSPQKTTRVIGGHPIELSYQEMPHKHTHIIFQLQKGTLYYNDTRMFGYLLYFPSWEALEKSGAFETYGVDPFHSDFTVDYFKQGMKKKKTKLKTVLMDQGIVVGLGNIYCDEVCFYAGVSPLRSTGSLKARDMEKLYLGIKEILPKAIELHGTSMSDYLLADGSRGNYARELKVYGRGGEPCVRCGNILKSTTINSRTTVYCEKCQK